MSDALPGFYASGHYEVNIQTCEVYTKVPRPFCILLLQMVCGPHACLVYDHTSSGRSSALYNMLTVGFSC